MQRTSLLLTEFFRLLEARGIAYCVMGDTRELPKSIGSDVDIVIPQDVVHSLPKLLHDYCDIYRLRLVQCLQHEANAYYFVVALEEFDGTMAFLALDLCGDYYRRARRLLTAKEVTTSAEVAVDATGNAKGFKVCAPAMEFCYYLLKKIDKEQLAARHAAHLTQQWHRDPVGAAQMIKRFFGRSFEARLLSSAAESGDWTTVAKLLPRMRARLHRRIRVRPAAMFAEVARRWRRWRQPTGLLVAALGPDGSGKSSAILAVDRQIRQAFRQSAIVHLRPGFLYRPERAPTRTPHALPPRGRIRSLVKLMFFAADYILGYVATLRPLLVRSNCLLFDRYYDDILVDPVRYRHAGSMRVARGLRSVVPRPDLWLLFDAPADVLQSRKQEVSPAESERQRLAYREVLRQQQHVAVIDASQPLHEVIAAATNAVLARCESITRARLGLPMSEPRSPLAARCLLFFCRHRVPLLSKLMRIAFNADIYCMTPRDLYLPHPYGIVIHSQARIGRRVTIMQQVTIGGKDWGINVAPIVGDGVYIGAGARVLGDIRIGDGAIIGANAVVTRDVPAGATVVGANRILKSATYAAVAEHDHEHDGEHDGDHVDDIAIAHPLRANGRDIESSSDVNVDAGVVSLSAQAASAPMRVVRR
jgi:serine acetyltransferase/thymidylate kinase